MKNSSDEIYLIQVTALKFLKEKSKTAEEVVSWLIEQGVSEKSSKAVVLKLQQQILRHKKGDVRNKILGGLFLVGIGVVLSYLSTRKIWIGSILLGLIQMFRGFFTRIE